MFRLRPLHLGILAAVASVAVIVVVDQVRLYRNSSPEDLMLWLPDGDATTVYLDVASVRSAGLLDATESVQVAEEDDYRRFVEATNFDYTTDLDAVLAAFHHDGTFMLVKGRFDWGRINNYVESQGGNCFNGRCQMSGSTPERQISLFAVTRHVMGMAISPDPYPVGALARRPKRPDAEPIPEGAPIWLRASGKRLAGADWLPTGARMFVSQVSDAKEVTLSLAPAENEFALRVDVDCDSAQQATTLSKDLAQVTDLLTSLIRREGMTPSDADLSGVLTQGSFRNQGTHMLGEWPIHRALILGMLEGPADTP